MGIIKRYNSTMYGNYWKGMLQYGFLIGLALSFVVLFRHWLILPLSQPVSYTENVALLVLMFLAVFFYKRNLEQRRITLKECYVVGIGSGIIGSVIYGMFLYLYASFIDVDIQQRCFELQKAIESNNIYNDLQLKEMCSPSAIAFSGVMLSSIMSVLWALLVAIVLRNEKAPIRVKEIKNKF